MVEVEIERERSSCPFARGSLIVLTSMIDSNLAQHFKDADSSGKNKFMGLIFNSNFLFYCKQ